MTVTIEMTKTVRYKSGRTLTKGQTFDCIRETDPRLTAEIGECWVVTFLPSGDRLVVSAASARELKQETMYRFPGGLVWFAGS